MELKTIVKNCGLIALLSCSLSVFAANEKIKCPPVNFLKSNYSDNLLRVSQEYQEPNKFSVESHRMLAVEDEENKYEWTINIFVETTQPKDFNEAHKNANTTLANIVKDDGDIEEFPGHAICSYVDKDGKILAVLEGYKIVKNHK